MIGIALMASALCVTLALVPRTAYALDDFLFDIGGEFGIVGIIVAGIIVAIVRALISSAARKRQEEIEWAKARAAAHNRKSGLSGSSWEDMSSSQIRSYLDAQGSGESVSASEFEKRMGDLYTRMQEGWDKGEIRRFKYNFTPEAWKDYLDRLQAETDSGNKTHIQNVRVKTIDMHVEHQPDGETVREVRIIADMQRYVTGPDDTVTGDQDVYTGVTTVWTMVRPDQSKDEWVISSIEEISADTPDKETDLRQKILSFDI